MDSEEDDTNTPKTELLNSTDTGLFTRVSDSQSSSDHELTLPLNDTLPLEGETQELELQDLDCLHIGKTQLLDTDGEGTDKTEVLSDNECETDAELDKETTQLLDDDALACERKTDSSIPARVDDSDDKHCSSGSSPRSFMSIRVESLRASGLAAARKMVPSGNDSGPRSIQGNSQSGVRKDDETSYIKDPGNNITQRRGDSIDHGALNCNGNIERNRDENECKGARSTARKLFAEDALGSDTDASDFDGTHHELARLSYVGSQEPGELSQANALNLVERLISNDDEFLQETNVGSTIKQKSAPASSAKGTQMLALKLRGSGGETDIFNWDDNHEDEGGGYFFNKRKEELLGGSFHVRQSYTNPKSNRPPNTKNGSKLHRNIKSLTHSDSRLIVQNFNENEKLQRVPKSRTIKNLLEELDGRLNSETSTRHLKAVGSSKDFLNIHEVANDTQTAAEALEAFHFGGPSNHTPNGSKGYTRNKSGNKVHSEKVSLQKGTSDSGGILRQSKRIKTLVNNLSSETSLKNSTDHKMKGFVSNSATKGKKSRVNVIKHLDTKTAADKKKASVRRSCESVDQVNTSAVNKIHMKEADEWRGSTTSDGKVPFNKDQMPEDYRISTPVAHRTRKSAVNTVKNSEFSCNDIADSRDDVVGGSGKRKRQMQEDLMIFTPIAHRTRTSIAVKTVKHSAVSTNDIRNDTDDVAAVTGRKRRQMCSGIDSPKLSNKKGKELLYDISGVREEESIQQEPSDFESHEKIAKICDEKRDTPRYPLRNRTPQNMSNHISEGANIEAPSTSCAIKDNRQSVTKQKVLKVAGRDTGGKIDQKRITRSSVQCNISSLSSQKEPDGTLKRPPVRPALTESVVNCSSAVTNEKLAPRDDVRNMLATCSDNKHGEDHLTALEGVGAKGMAEVSPSYTVKQSGAARVTSTSNCTTPINAASPVCVGDDYDIKSCKKSLSKSPLMRELNRLDANEVLHSPASKDSRKRKDVADVRVLFSNHLDEDIIRQQKKILVRLGASVACTLSEATHFITNMFVRTRNMLEAIACGKPVVTHLWLESCGQASCILDEKKYILMDSKKEKEVGFSMPVSLARARRSPLLESKRVYITPNTKPSKELLASLVKAVHGQVVEKLGSSTIKDDDLLVLSCEEDYAICVPLLEKGTIIYGSELLLNGIVIQKLEYERHRIFTDHGVRKTRSRTLLRKGDKNSFIS